MERAGTNHRELLLPISVAKVKRGVLNLFLIHGLRLLLRLMDSIILTVLVMAVLGVSQVESTIRVIFRAVKRGKAAR